MKLLNQLERKYGKYAIHNLMLYIVFANGAIYLFDTATGGSLSPLLALVPSLVKQGEVWRLVTFLLMPSGLSLIFFIFVLYFYYMIGSALEQEWGVFKFNVYFFLGAIIMMITSMVFNVNANVQYLHTTLFLAFATIYPDFQIRLYMILPIKVKYLAYISVGFLLFSFLVGGWGTKLSILAGVANYLIFFGKELYTSQMRKAKSTVRKQNYARENRPTNPYMHKCHTCGRTELDDASLEFRYCSKCEGYYEYCSDHLKDHEHVKSE